MSCVDSGWRHFSVSWTVRELFRHWDRCQEEDVAKMFVCPRTHTIVDDKCGKVTFGFSAQIRGEDVDVFMSLLEGPPKCLVHIRHTFGVSTTLQPHFVSVTKEKPFRCDWSREMLQADETDDGDDAFNFHCAVDVSGAGCVFDYDSVFLDELGRLPGCVAKSGRMTHVTEALFDRDMPLADLEIKSDGGGSVQCHKIVLAAWSPVIKHMLAKSKEAKRGEIFVNGCSSKVFEQFVRLLYKGRMDFEQRSHKRIVAPEMLIGLISLSEKLGANDLKTDLTGLLREWIYDEDYFSYDVKDIGEEWSRRLYALIDHSRKCALPEVTESLLHLIYQEGEGGEFYVENATKYLHRWGDFVRQNPELGGKVDRFFEEKEKRPVVECVSE